MIDRSGCPRVERNQVKHSGDWLFVGMRVQVATCLRTLPQEHQWWPCWTGPRAWKSGR